MKRRILKLTLFLLTGAIINVAMAWGCALWATPHDPWIKTDFNGPLPEYIVKHVPAEWLNKSILADFSCHWLTNLERQDSIGLSLFVFRSTFHEFGTFSLAPDPIRQMALLRSGWPMRCFESHILLEGRYAQGKWVDGLPAPMRLSSKPFISMGGPSARVLPARVISPGFAINTIFYAAILWMLFAVPGAVRRRVRIRRGQCASCGYSLRGTPHSEKCPECGAAV